MHSAIIIIIISWPCRPSLSCTVSHTVRPHTVSYPYDHHTIVITQSAYSPPHTVIHHHNLLNVPLLSSCCKSQYHATPLTNPESNLPPQPSFPSPHHQSDMLQSLLTVSLPLFIAFRILVLFPLLIAHLVFAILYLVYTSCCRCLFLLLPIISHLFVQHSSSKLPPSIPLHRIHPTPHAPICVFCLDSIRPLHSVTPLSCPHLFHT